MLQALGVSSRLQEAPVTYQTLVDEIAQDHVVLAGIVFSQPNGTQGGHAVVIAGYHEDEFGQFVIVYDPVPNSRHIGSVNYEDLLTSYGSGYWACTWTSLRRQDGTS